LGERKSSEKWRGVIASTTTSNDEAFAKATIAKTAQRMLPGMAAFIYDTAEGAAANIQLLEYAHSAS
jgi:hypothetical protein